MNPAHLRAILGLLWVVLVPHLPLEAAGAAILFALWFASFVIARAVTLTEPGCRRYLATHPVSMYSHVLESLVVTACLLLSLNWLWASEVLTVPLPNSVAIVTVSFIVYPFVLWLGEGRDTDKEAWTRARPWLAATAFIMEQGVLLSGLLVTEGELVRRYAAPWTALDILTAPLFAVVFLCCCYPPIARMARAASDTPDASSPGEVLVVQIAALYVFALTGTPPPM